MIMREIKAYKVLNNKGIEMLGARYVADLLENDDQSKGDPFKYIYDQKNAYIIIESTDSMLAVFEGFMQEAGAELKELSIVEEHS